MPRSEMITEPIPISLVSGRYLLYDIDVVTYLRRTHNILGVLIGGIPQAPQQNVFQGLPLELLPEEVKLLVEKEIACIIDDQSWHEEYYTTLHGTDRQKYLGSLRAQGLKASQAASAMSRQKQEKALARQAMLSASKSPHSSPAPTASETSSAGQSSIIPQRSEVESLFNESEPARPLSPGLSVSSKSSLKIWSPSQPQALTPTTSYCSSSLPKNSASQLDPIVPASYPLFRHLHTRKYFIMPGLRFGCNYNVYPGDPLRFHSHFIATSYGWHEQIPILDLVGGGRLGTGVKKGFLIGGEDLDGEPEGDDRVKTFVLEWAGM